MTELLPTLDTVFPISPLPSPAHSGGHLTARLYAGGNASHFARLPKVDPKVRCEKIKQKVKSVRKDLRYKIINAEVSAPTEATEDGSCLSDSDSDSDYSSSSGVKPGDVDDDSEKTQVDHLLRYSGTGITATHSDSQETIPVSPSLFASVSLPSMLEESLSLKNMRRHVASDLLRHNHHILLHRGQCALNSHIQITVNSKAANDIAAHAVVTEVPALLPSHRRRAHLAALTGQRLPLGVPPISPKTQSSVAPPKALTITLPPHHHHLHHHHHHAASPPPSLSRNGAVGMKSPPLSPRGTALLSPMSASPTKLSHGAVHEKSALSITLHRPSC